MTITKNMPQEAVLENVKNGILSKFPLLGAVMANLNFKAKENIPTAETDGKNIFYSPEFIKGLSYDEKVFLFSHEIMHDAFDHIMRSKGKDPVIWNIATDAVINQMLKSAKLPLPEGGVDIPEAAGKSAEEIYKNLLEKKKQQEGKRQDQGDNNSAGADQDAQYTYGNYQQGESIGQHGIWAEVVELAEKEMQAQAQKQAQEQAQAQAKSKIQNKESSLKKEGDQQSSLNKEERKESENPSNKTSISSSEMEKQFVEVNEELKKEIAEKVRKQLKVKQDKKAGKTEKSLVYKLGEVGEARAVVSWKKILKRELEKEEERWSYRRAEEDNDFQARIGTFEVEDYPETEVMLDTSGSVSDNLLRSFLRQLKPLLKESKLKVGCFDGRFYGFSEIKTKKDIDKFKIIGRGGTNFDNALKNFTNDTTNKKTNKIIFTDGYDKVTDNEFNRKMKVFWIVYGNKDFDPCCGKVIYVDKNEFKFIKTNADEDFK